MTADQIKKILANSSYDNLFIPEFTWENLRIDAIRIDTKHRWIRGYEIKINRKDFLNDDKWTQYSEFCSSICIVCPENLIKPEEVKKPFGLIYVLDKSSAFAPTIIKYIKKPLNFQKRNSLSWLYIYLKVLELEFRRIHYSLKLSHPYV